MAVSRFLCAWMVAVSTTCASPHAVAADFRINISSGYRDLVIEGAIEGGDYERFTKIAKENQGQLAGIYILSPGGDFLEAMKIGRAVRALELSSMVPMRSPTGRPVCDDDAAHRPRDPANCSAASAGFFVHIGAVHRGGTFLAVHRPYFAREQFANLSEPQAQAAFERLQREAKSYMTEMGVPPHVQEDVLGTPSDKALVLDERTVKTYFWGEPPYRHEWRMAKCARLSPDEARRLDSIGARLLSTPNARVNADEQSELTPLQAKRDLESECHVALIRESRLAAYEKFFGAAPSDAANYNFSKWADVQKYLGRAFEEIVAEERFEQGDKVLGTTSLERQATANSPRVALMDSRERKKYVSWIAVVSQPNPSVSFVQRVRSSLESAWGRPSSTSGINEWAWKSKSFTARLKQEPVSAQGPYLSLVVEAIAE